MAAVLGSRLNDIEMYRLADVTIGQAMTALGRLADLKVLRDGGRGLEFCNEVVRGEAYLGIPSPVRRILHRSISDQLVKREANGTAVSGLEIAWHCIRCGLLEVATPYLLRGARQAIRKGAPNEAERALETALGHLDEPARTDALLLMSEALYEQGKWELLLEKTHSCTFTTDDPRKVAALTLQLEPRFRLGLTNHCSSDEIVRDVKALPLTMADVSFRIRAIRYVAYVLVIRRDDALAALLSDMINCFRDVPLEIEYAANLSVARATLHYHNRDIGAAVTALQCAAEGLDAEGIRNLVSSGVRLGLANIYSSSGQYDLAVEENLKAFRIANMLDNNRNLSRIAANISMCHARLGGYSEAISWGMRSVELNTSFNFDFRPYALLHIGSSMAMLGRNEEAEEVLRRLVKVAECATDASLHQNAALYAAEVAAVMGQHTTAMHLARSAMGRSSKLLYKNSAGIFARWSTKVLFNDRSATAAKELLGAILEQLADYDTIDQADVISASVWLDYRMGKRDSNKIDQLKRLLGRLPRGITVHLRRTGFLEFDS
jgi:tetratricopeptide (TPR) repeat protein